MPPKALPVVKPLLPVADAENDPTVDDIYIIKE
jgi:hypothetical protein